MSGRHGGVCGDVLEAYPLSEYLPGISPNVGIGEGLLGVAYFANAALMLFWIYQQRIKAMKGIDGAAMYVIFPVYLPFMYMSFFSDTTVGLLTLFAPIHYWGSNTWPMAVLSALVYGLQHFVLEGIAFTMMQYGCGYQAAYRAGSYAFIWACLTFLDQLFVRREGPTEIGFGVDFLWNFILFLFYTTLWLAPYKTIFRRPSVIFYAKFWAFFRLLYIAGLSLAIYWVSITRGAGYCSFVFGNAALFVLCKPYVVYHTLLKDSMWWQGLGQQPVKETSSQNSEDSGSASNSSGNISDVVAAASGEPDNSDDTVHDVENGNVLTTSNYITSIFPFSGGSAKKKRFKSVTYKKRTYRALSNPLLGMEVGFSEAQELAKEVDNLRTVGDVKLLNFAFLSLKKSAPILGSGSFSKVYSGEYCGQPVAIKMLFTPDLNPEVIRRCCNEAQLLSRIRHENIVTIFGVAVLPPSVCIVLEKCEYGSLADVLRGSSNLGNNFSKSKPPLPLSKADRMFLALGCCRGVAAMHKYSSTFVHRDIKSFNFLVDSQLVVKLADLELGSTSLDDKSDTNETQSPEAVSKTPQAFNSSMMMSSWQAPEVISGEEYQQASDVYSLAIVLWEIIVSAGNSTTPSGSLGHSGGNSYASRLSTSTLMSAFMSSATPITNPWMHMPFGDCVNQTDVRRKILAGERPAMPRTSINSKYNELIERGWNKLPQLRPSAEEAASIVEKCWLDSIQGRIKETPYIVDINKVHETYLRFYRKSNEDMSRASSSSIPPQQSSFLPSLTNKKISRSLALNPPPIPPSPSLLAALSVMQLEQKWLQLEEDGAFVVLSPRYPYLILWATRSWCKMTGYLLNEVLANDLSVIEGSSSDRQLLLDVLSSAAVGTAKHGVSKHYCKDKSSFVNSFHATPVLAAPSSPSQLSGVKKISSLNRLDSLNNPNSEEPSIVRPSSPDFSRGRGTESRVYSSLGKISSINESEDELLPADEAITPLIHHSAEVKTSSSSAAYSPFSQFIGNFRFSQTSTHGTLSSARTTNSTSREEQLSDSQPINVGQVAYVVVLFSSLKSSKV